MTSCQHKPVDTLATSTIIHFVDAFRKILKKVVADEFDNSQRALALKAGIFNTQVSRCLTKERGASPEVVGKIAGACSRLNRQALITAYLQAVASETDLNVEVAVTLK